MRRILVALLIFGIAGAASAAVNNIQVSGDITTQAITRDLSLGEVGEQDSEDFILTQVRLRFDADLTENVSAVVQLLNERLWGAENDTTSSTSTDVKLDLAYLVMKNMIYDPLTVTIGRQNLRFGRGLIVGDPDTDNVVDTNSGLATVADDLSLRKSFDAVRATLDYDPLVLDIIFAKVREGSTNIADDQNLYGVNAAYNLSDKTNLEGYFFVKDKDNVTINNGGSSSGIGMSNDRVYTIGLRGDTTAIDNLTLYGEYAYQFGKDYATAGTILARDAFAAQVGAVYAFQDKRNSQVGLEYTYLSGDSDSSDNDQTAWDPMFEDQRVGEIANLLFDNTNLQYIKLSAATDLREDITAGLDVYYLRLAKSYASTSLATSSPSPSFMDIASLSNFLSKDINCNCSILIEP
ncbi:MAG: hypothetical protein DRJ45_07195 [Thermoprotei archaeon]|nr:MAG: hypothetical protein DRJ45_07195 [Thermoprotei archaeon]